MSVMSLLKNQVLIGKEKPKVQTVSGGTTGRTTGLGTTGVATSAGTQTGLGDNTDYSALFGQRVNEGAGYDELNRIAAARALKTSTNPQYSQYSGDAMQQAMEAYLARIKSQEKPTYQGYTSMGDMWNNGGYSQVLDAQQQALDAYIKRQTNSLQSQKAGVSQSADQAAQQAYISYMMGKKNMPQAMAAAGYSGGMADSQALALESGYQGNLKDILLNRDNALNDIDTAINNAKLEGSIQAAQAQADLGRDAISAWQSYLARQNDYANSDFWTKYGYEFQGGQAQQDRDFQAQQAQLGRDFQAGQSQLDRDYQSGETDRDRAWNLILNGIIPEAALLGKAGLSEAEAQAYVARVQSQQNQLQRASSGSGGSGPWKPTLTYSQVMDAIDRGIVNDTIKKAYRYYIGQDYDEGKKSDLPETPQGYENVYNAIAEKMNETLSRQGYAATKAWAADYLEQIYDAGGITDEEFEALGQDLLGLLNQLVTGGSKGQAGNSLLPMLQKAGGGSPILKGSELFTLNDGLRGGGGS